MCELENLAREYCKALGIDPDEKVSAGALDIRTDKEIEEDFPDGVFVPDVALVVPVWQTYRKEVAKEGQNDG